MELNTAQLDIPRHEARSLVAAYRRLAGQERDEYDEIAAAYMAATMTEIERLVLSGRVPVPR